jgi:DNA repair protein RecN (Recombination protein N)
MIDFLKISSMAIFDLVSVEFGEGLNCITGETGAGKSLILGALTLLMGARTSSEIVRPGREKAVIEALFTAKGEEFVLKREIHASGRNRCFINGELATTERLAELSSGLVHIYGQHQYQDLLNPKEHVRILEELSGLSRAGMMDAYSALQEVHQRSQEIEKAIAQAQREKEDLDYRQQELKTAQVEEGEEERLKRELDMARVTEELRQLAMGAFGILYSNNQSILDQLSLAKNHIQRIASHDTRMKASLEALETIIAQVEDVALNIRALNDSYSYDPERIEMLEERLHLIRDLKRKYRTDESGLLDILKGLAARLALIADSNHLLEEARATIICRRESYLGEAKQFLSRRKIWAEEFSRLVNHDLNDLGMTGTQFAVSQLDACHLETLDEATDLEGIEPARLLRGEFMIATNVGQNTLPLARIASGGELSRIMLAIKVQQRTSQDATLIFDEIDAGISGQTAFMIAAKLKSISEHAQTIVITHIHQMASLANSHLVVSKGVQDNATISTIRKVSGTERVMELARMMGGEHPSPKVIEHAKELIRSQRGARG